MAKRMTNMAMRREAARAKAARTPRFKRGSRVAWNDGTRERFGTVRELHKLGGHGRAYEVLADGETLPDEITEGELRALAPLDDPALRELLAAGKEGRLSPAPTGSGEQALARWLAAGCPGFAAE